MTIVERSLRHAVDALPLSPSLILVWDVTQCGRILGIRQLVKTATSNILM